MAALAPARHRRERSTCTSTTRTRCSTRVARGGRGRGRRLGDRARRHGGDAVTRARERTSRRGSAHRRRALPRPAPVPHRLHGGGCTPDQVRAWVVNRYYYQSRIPMKDAAFMSRVEDPALRRAWRSRIEDHDGDGRRRGRHRAAGCGSPRRWGSIPPTSRSCAASCRRRASPSTPTCASCASDAARGGGRVADRALRPEDPRRAHRGPARALRLRRRRAALLLPQPARRGAERRGLRPRLRARACRHRREAGRRRRGAHLQDRRALGAARRARAAYVDARRASRPAPGRRARASCEAAA